MSKILYSSTNGASSHKNEFILEHRDSFHELGCEWNYMPFLPNAVKTNNPNFFHLVGIQGKMIINKLQDNNIDILDFFRSFNK